MNECWSGGVEPAGKELSRESACVCVCVCKSGSRWGMCFGNAALSSLAGLSGEDEWSHNKGSSALSAALSTRFIFTRNEKKRRLNKLSTFEV